MIVFYTAINHNYNNNPEKKKKIRSKSTDHNP